MSGANTLPQFEDFKATDGDSPSSQQARAFRDEPAVRDGEAPKVGEPGVNPLVSEETGEEEE